MVDTSEAAFHAALQFVWQPGYDDPADGYHDDPRDPGGGTKGGVIEATWNACRAKGIVTGTLPGASNHQLATVLRSECWGIECDAIPASLAFLLFNGRMMTGRYVLIFQACLGIPQDGVFGPQTVAAAHAADPAKLNDELQAAHLSYLRRLYTWHTYGNGWTKRINAAHAMAAKLIAGVPVASPAPPAKPAAPAEDEADALDDLYNHPPAEPVTLE